jgi:hypothetical protein
MRWAGHVARKGEDRKVLVGKPEAERSRHRWEEGIRTDLREVG